jgi:D-hexose-6-phosphate mutarotase
MDTTTLQALNAQFAIPGHLAFRSGPGGLVRAVIENPQATAEIALQGAQVLAFQPQGSGPVLFLSTNAVYAPGKAIRGGIPICWPWFGPHPTDPDKPQHGFARTLPWAVLGTVGRDDGTTEVRLGLQDTPATRALWPHPFALTLVVQVGRELRVVLETHNPGAAPMTVTEALHAYFQIGDLAALTIQGLEGTTYIDKVAGDQRRVQAGPVTISGEADRVYIDTTAACVVDDPGLQRRMEIAKEGSRSTVVWNPGPEKAARMADLGGDEYTRMVCVEVANALDDRVVVAPGADHRLAMVIRVAPSGATPARPQS